MSEQLKNASILRKAKPPIGNKSGNESKGEKMASFHTLKTAYSNASKK